MRCAILGFAGGVAVLQTRAALPDSATIIALAAVGGSLLLPAARNAGRPPVRLLLGRAARIPRPGGRSFRRPTKAAISPSPARSTACRTNSSRACASISRWSGCMMRRSRCRRRFRWPGTRGFREATQQVGDVQPGERWQLRCACSARTATPIRMASITKSGCWSRACALPATCGRQARANRRVDSFVAQHRNVVEHCRAVLRERIVRALEGKQYAGVIVALVVGDQRAIDQSDWTVFNRTGVGHLISISGLHITMVAGLVRAARLVPVAAFFFTSAQLPLLLPAQKVAALGRRRTRRCSMCCWPDSAFRPSARCTCWRW